MSPTIVWFRRDLRIGDNPALSEAVRSGSPVVPVFVWSPGEEGEWRLGTAARWWLRRSLERLDRDLQERGARLVVVRGPVAAALDKLARKTGARRLVWNRSQEPGALAIEGRVRELALASGLSVATFEGTRLTDEKLRTSTGETYRRFTPFYRKFMAEIRVSPPIGAPSVIPGPDPAPGSRSETVLDDIDRGHRSLATVWTPGSGPALERLDRFVSDAAAGYAALHDRVDRPGTSLLSPHLAFGEISARQVLEVAGRAPRSASRDGFLRQLIWREFAHEQLGAFPQIVDTPLNAEFVSLPTLSNTDHFRLWQEGRTGYPLVDAAMRQLAEMGWIHNRTRMVAASFLVKHLGLPWQWGAHWFWDRLVDADVANNSLNWQWVAGCGVDSSPYYRIFNPTRQGQRFDPDGEYARRWLPELAKVPPSLLYGSPDSVAWQNVSYPRPIVAHEEARVSALSRYAQVRQTRREVRAR